MTKKEFYTQDEVDAIMYDYIRETAEDLQINLSNDNKEVYV